MERLYRGLASFKVETDDIQHLSQEVCEELECADVVVKLTGNQKHSYRVSYKEAGVGMCLTYTDASLAETISYDCVDGVWTYNSTDSTPLGA